MGKIIFTGVVVVVLVGIGTHFDVQAGKRRQQRQEEVNTFYAKHKCRPEGYLSTRYEVLRTYRCDNGLFIAEDMLKGE